MFDTSGEERRSSLLSGTVKAVVVIGVLSWMSAGWLSSASHDGDTLARLASNISQGRQDPLTTGSIAGRASATRIDPCALPRR